MRLFVAQLVGSSGTIFSLSESGAWTKSKQSNADLMHDLDAVLAKSPIPESGFLCIGDPRSSPRIRRKVKQQAPEIKENVKGK